MSSRKGAELSFLVLLDTEFLTPSTSSSGSVSLPLLLQYNNIMPFLLSCLPFKHESSLEQTTSISGLRRGSGTTFSRIYVLLFLRIRCESKADDE